VPAETPTTSPAVTKLLGFVDQFKSIANDAFAAGDQLAGSRALIISVKYLQAARAMQNMADRSKAEAANARR
jgi:hypothetical protein